jgi:hypothetical protein
MQRPPILSAGHFLLPHHAFYRPGLERKHICDSLLSKVKEQITASRVSMVWNRLRERTVTLTSARRGGCPCPVDKKQESAHTGQLALRAWCWGKAVPWLLPPCCMWWSSCNVCDQSWPSYRNTHHKSNTVFGFHGPLLLFVKLKNHWFLIKKNKQTLAFSLIR